MVSSYEKKSVLQILSGTRNFHSKWETVFLRLELTVLETYLVTIKYQKRKFEFENNVDPDEVAHYEPPHLDLYCLPAFFFNIGIKHGFPCINVCQVPREMLKTEAVG